jgi:hypothetical protein
MRLEESSSVSFSCRVHPRAFLCPQLTCSSPTLVHLLSGAVVLDLRTRNKFSSWLPCPGTSSPMDPMRAMSTGLPTNPGEETARASANCYIGTGSRTRIQQRQQTRATRGLLRGHGHESGLGMAMGQVTVGWSQNPPRSHP